MYKLSIPLVVTMTGSQMMGPSAPCFASKKEATSSTTC